MHDVSGVARTAWDVRSVDEELDDGQYVLKLRFRSDTVSISILTLLTYVLTGGTISYKDS